MAQTIVVQEQALAAAQKRIEQLERQGSQQPPQERGGLLSGLFGGSASQTNGVRQPSSVPSTGRASPWGQQATSGQAMSGRSGGFLAGAAQTAMGVAGGVLLGNAIAGMFGGDEAKAAEPAAAASPAEEPAAEEPDLGGGDDFEL